MKCGGGEEGPATTRFQFVASLVSEARGDTTCGILALISACYCILLHEVLSAYLPMYLLHAASLKACPETYR